MQGAIIQRAEIAALIRLIFAYNSSMQLAAPQPRRHWNAWDVVFFDIDRMRTALPRRARFNSDEALIEFAQRAGGIKMSEDRQILDMMISARPARSLLTLRTSSTRRWN